MYHSSNFFTAYFNTFTFPLFSVSHEFYLTLKELNKRIQICSFKIFQKLKKTKKKKPKKRHSFYSFDSGFFTAFANVYILNFLHA